MAVIAQGYGAGGHRQSLDAARIGTAFLGYPEASVAPPHRVALRAAGEDPDHPRFTGKPARVLANRYVLETADALPFPGEGRRTRSSIRRP